MPSITDHSQPAARDSSPMDGTDESNEAEQRPDAEQEELRGHWGEERVHRAKERSANTALTVLNIIRSFALMQCNVVYLSKKQRLFELIARLSHSGDWFDVPIDSNEDTTHLEEQMRREDQNETPFTMAEAVRVRKEVLQIFNAVAGEHMNLTLMSDDTIKSIFELLVSFIVDAKAAEEEGGYLDTAFAGHMIRRVPFHADIALDSFAKMAQPDKNREILSRVIAPDDLLELGKQLVHLLPVSEEDYFSFKTEARLEYVLRIAMGLFNIAFLATQEVKRKLRDSPGITSVVFMTMKRLTRQSRDFQRNPFNFLIARLSETLKLINDSNDIFSAPDLMGLGVTSELPSSGKLESSSMSLGKTSVKQEAGVLVGYEDDVLELLNYPNLDPSIVSELDALCAF